MPDIHADRVLILDFGAQYTQLIARRVRELGVYSEIYPCDADAEQIRRFAPKAIILSGGPESVYDVKGPEAPPIVFSSGVPLLGICYGMQTMAAQLGGQVESSSHREFGAAQVRPTGDSPLLDGLEDNRDNQGRRVLDVWMSHGDRVVAVPPGFKIIGSSDNAPLAAMADEARRFYGLQFHPEVTHTLQGAEILRRFVREIAGCSANWATGNIIEDSVARIRAQVGKEKVLLGLSGGVDSSVLAALLHRAIGAQLTCVFVDHGLLRLGEGDQVMATFAEHMGVRVIRVDAEQRFLTALAGESDPEKKRKIIGRMFVEVFDEQAAALKDVQVARAGHDLSRCDRIGRRQDRQGPRHQVAPQCGRIAAAHEARAVGAAARTVQGRSAQAGRRTWVAEGHGASASLSGPGPRRAHLGRNSQARMPIY